MQVSRVPAPLRDKLGAEATSGLLDLFEDVRKEWTGDMVMLCTERFERRLIEETSKLRAEMGQGFSQLRVEMAQGFATQLKWMFLFWVGQVVAMAAIMGVMLRGGR